MSSLRMVLAGGKTQASPRGVRAVRTPAFGQGHLFIPQIPRPALGDPRAATRAPGYKRQRDAGTRVDEPFLRPWGPGASRRAGSKMELDVTGCHGQVTMERVRTMRPLRGPGGRDGNAAPHSHVRLLEMSLSTRSREPLLSATPISQKAR